MLFLIPARAGSKRLKNKNRLPFCGLPLWLWSYATAMRVKSKGDSIMVSTDDPDIYATALTLDVIASCRPTHLCGDDSPTQALVDWVFENYSGTDAICLLQATSPGRSDDLVHVMVNRSKSQVRSTTAGEPNGQCYIFRRNATAWLDIETAKGFDVDTREDFDAAERHMLRRFA